MRPNRNKNYEIEKLSNVGDILEKYKQKFQFHDFLKANFYFVFIYFRRNAGSSQFMV